VVSTVNLVEKLSESNYSCTITAQRLAAA